jgi:hypothetical protein
VANSRVARRMLRSEVLRHKFTDIRKKLRDDPSASKGNKTDVIGAMRISLLIAPGKGSGPAVASLWVEAQSRFRGKISSSRHKTVGPSPSDASFLPGNASMKLPINP